MYRNSDLVDAFYGLLGWRQNYDTQELTIAQSLTQSSSGQYFQSFHKLNTLTNIKSLAPDFSNITYDAWNNANNYLIGDRVTYDSLNYRALTNSSNLQPDLNPDAWEQFTAFSEWLEIKTKDSISNMFSSFWAEHLVSKLGKNILSNKVLFDGAGRIGDTIEGESLVGFELVPIRAKGITTKINKIGLQFTGANNVTIYLYHSSRKTPITQQTFNRTRDGGMEWFEVNADFLMPYISDDIDSGGSWYLVYDQSQLGGSLAVNKNKDWSKAPCSTCNRQEIISYNIWSKYLEIHPFKTADYDNATNELWDISTNTYTYSSNYGINLDITLECDVTDTFIANKNIFINALGLQVAKDMLEEFAYNPSFRIGRAQQNMNRLELLYALDGSKDGYYKGVNYELKKALEAVHLDVTALSDICFPCTNKNGIKVKTIG